MSLKFKTSKQTYFEIKKKKKVPYTKITFWPTVKALVVLSMLEKLIKTTTTSTWLNELTYKLNKSSFNSCGICFNSTWTFISKFLQYKANTVAAYDQSLHLCRTHKGKHKWALTFHSNSITVLTLYELLKSTLEKQGHKNDSNNAPLVSSPNNVSL